MQEKEQICDQVKVQDHTRLGDVHEYLGDILGAKYKEYRKKWDRAKELKEVYDFPLFLVYELFWKCNLKCIMCLHSNSNKASSLEYEDRISWEMYVNTMREASKYGCPSITIGGLCEPLLDNRLPEMIAMAKDSGIIDIMINTNATLLNEEYARKLLESGLTRLRIGFDGATAKTYEKVRVGADFEKVKSNIINFVKLRDKLNLKLPVVRVSCVHLSSNDLEIDDFVKFWKPIVDYVSIQRYRPHELTKERSRNNIGAGVKISDNLKCSEPWERLYIRGNGDVYSCCQPAYGPQVGNLRENGLYEIWNSKTMNNLRIAIKNNDWKNIPACKKCVSHFSA